MTHLPTSETRAQVKALAEVGLIQQHIGDYLGITQKTLRKYYIEELRTGIASAAYKAALVLFNKIVYEGDVGAAKFYLRTRGGWVDNVDEKQSEKNANLKDKASEADNRKGISIMEFTPETRKMILRERKRIREERNDD